MYACQVPRRRRVEEAAAVEKPTGTVARPSVRQFQCEPAQPSGCKRMVNRAIKLRAKALSAVIVFVLFVEGFGQGTESLRDEFYDSLVNEWALGSLPNPSEEESACSVRKDHTASICNPDGILTRSDVNIYCAMMISLPFESRPSYLFRYAMQRMQTMIDDVARQVKIRCTSRGRS